MKSKFFDLFTVFLACFLVMFVFQELAFGQEGGGEGEKKPQNALYWLIITSGWIGAIILAISVYFFSVVVQQFLELRAINVAPPDLVSECERLVNEGNIKDLFTVVEADDSFLGKTLHAGLLELDYGVDEAREKLERTAEAETVNMEKKITILATIGTLGPMIGLLGTLKGMISSFAAIATAGTKLDGSKVADGISEALLLTFEGVALSIPAIFLYAFFRGRISKFSVETTMLADDFLRAAVRALKRQKAKAPSA